MAIKFFEGPILSDKQMYGAMKKYYEGTLDPPKRANGAGRPVSGKETVTLRLREDVVAYYKSLGDDWRDRMAADLAKATSR